MSVIAEKFSSEMKRLGLADSGRVAVAVSGGGDSLALCLLAQDWARGNVLALTVDHGLRPESAKEACRVRQLLEARGIAHKILTWQGEKPSARVQELARQERYRLLMEACRRENIGVLAVAHNIEDQMETFWMRLAHGSGLDGLSAMAPSRDVDGVRLIRPLLGFTRDELRSVCRARGVEWIDDPSNADRKYLRVRLRQFEGLLAEEGLTPARLSQTLQKLEYAHAALEEIAARAYAGCVLLRAEGYAALRGEGWKKQPRDIGIRILSRVLQTVSGEAYPAGFEALRSLAEEMGAPSFAGRTLSGCEIFSAPGDTFIICREAAAMEGRRKICGEDLVWDRRFVTRGFSSESLEIGGLGENGVSELRKHISSRTEEERLFEALPFKIKKTLPALWRGENLLAVPHLSYLSPAAPQELAGGRIIFIKQGVEG